MRLATAYPRLVVDDLSRRGIEADVIRLDGAVEISVQLGVADVIADVVGSGRTLRQHDLVAFGDVICKSEAILVQREGSERTPAKAQLTARLRGVVLAQQYLMLDYDCPKALLEQALKITPGLESPTVAPLADDELDRGAGDGVPQRGQPDHGRAADAGREGDPRLRHPLVPTVILPAASTRGC